MWVQVVLPPHDVLCLRLADVHQVLDRLGLIHRGAPLGDQHPASTYKRLEHHTQIPEARVFVRIVEARRASGGRRMGRADILHHWLGPFSPVDQRLRRLLSTSSRKPPIRIPLRRVAKTLTHLGQVEVVSPNRNVVGHIEAHSGVHTTSCVYPA
jgi:hypothetical protein